MTNSKSAIETKSLKSYDDTPYESYPFAITSPYHLMTLAVLFGMQPVQPEKARVLELGCASGGNIIPHAVNYPEAEFVGVDLSKIQIDEAKAHVANLGLKNMTFHQCSITEIDESFGKFDYIIAHGIISWVPDSVKDKIFEVCEKNLSKNGLAYISYNTLPGWNMIRTVRDMMLYHASTFTDPKSKVTQARLLLDFVKDSLSTQDTAYSEVLKNEALLLSDKSDYYLLHEHLEEENKQYYFTDFIAEATKHNLQYLSDSSLSSMYLGNMPPKVAEQLSSINDIVRVEQYMDFINNRRFRTSILCHKDIKLSRMLTNEDITKFYMSLPVVPECEFDKKRALDNGEKLVFFYKNSRESSIDTISPNMKAILYSFAETQTKPISFDELISLSAKKLGTDKTESIRTEFVSQAMSLALKGYLQLTLQKPFAKVNLDKPKVSKMVAYQASAVDSKWVTNLNHTPIPISLLERYCFKYMDGTRAQNEIVDSVKTHVDLGEININRATGVKIEDAKEITTALKEHLLVIIKNAEANMLLV